MRDKQVKGSGYAKIARREAAPENKSENMAREEAKMK